MKLPLYITRYFYITTITTALSTIPVSAQNVNSDHWSATDGLGRTIGRYDNVRNSDKQIIMFYWTWHQWNEPKGKVVKNNTEILRKHPEASLDANHPAWNEGDSGRSYWDEPLFGYYRTTDTWVLRKHAEMLADAKVDAVFFDCTNGAQTWDASTDSLMKVWDKAQHDGVKVPKIGFMLPFGPNDWGRRSLRHLYERIYAKGLYKNLWYYLDGKPVIMAYSDNLTNSKEDRAILKFFTFRPGQPDYVNGPDTNYVNQWGWLENYPQHGYVKLPDGGYELVTVGIAQNAAPETKGHCSAFNLPGSHSRSFTLRKGFDPRPDGYLYGWNFEEQWERAYELNPKAVFITGWNEWVGSRYVGERPWTGKPYSYVDEYDWDRSRDIEPVKSWGDCSDVYYMQLVDRVRKFKGTEMQPAPSASKTIKKWEDWKEVMPQYNSYRGNTMHRNADGSCQYHYVNNSGRNDIVSARVARDHNKIYFYVETADKLSPRSDRNWMMLLIDTDRNKFTGWQGYDYVINYKNPKGTKAFIQSSYQNKWIWKDAGTCRIKQDGNHLMITVPRKLIKQQDKTLDFEFKWSDNMQDEGNIMDFYVNGDCAPGGRFNYVFKE